MRVSDAAVTAFTRHAYSQRCSAISTPRTLPCSFILRPQPDRQTALDRHLEENGFVMRCRLCDMSLHVLVMAHAGEADQTKHNH